MPTCPALAARAIGRFRSSSTTFRDGSLRVGAQSIHVFLQPFVLKKFAIERDIYFLERPVFIEIHQARSVAVKLLPSPCRGVTHQIPRTNAQAWLSTRHIPSSRCRRHPFAGVFDFFSSWMGDCTHWCLVRSPWSVVIV